MMVIMGDESYVASREDSEERETIRQVDNARNLRRAEVYSDRSTAARSVFEYDPYPKPIYCGRLSDNIQPA